MFIEWQKLAEIEELRDYFETDFHGYQQQIEALMHRLHQLGKEELDKLAILRALEVTNGCTQWAFRRQDPECLSVEQTRECMRMVIGFIGQKRIDLPSGKSITFNPQMEQIMDQVQALYREAFKRNDKPAEQAFYAHSTAQFLACGPQRLAWAFQIVEQEFGSLFTAYYIARGRAYVARYMAGISSAPEVLS